MSISAADMRLLKKAVCDRLANVTGIGEVIPSRQVFADKAEYFATVAPKAKQGATEKTAVACAMVSLSSPRRRIDEQNDKIFHMDFSVRLFREAFPGRVDETSSPDAFRRKLLASEDAFDAAAVNLGWQFREEFAVSGLSAGLEATVLPIDTTEGQIAFGPPDFLPTVEGHYLELTVTVEAVYDDC